MADPLKRTCRGSMHSIAASLTVALALFATSAMALSTDKDQPIEIEANFAELDELRGVTVYRGDVVVIQGSMRMTGDELTVNFTDDQQLDSAVMLGSPNTLATFRQRPDGAAVDTEGEAQRLEYYALQSLLFLIETAKITQGERVMTADRMSYDTERGLLKGRGAPAGAPAEERSSSTSGGRVKLVIPPKRDNP